MTPHSFGDVQEIADRFIAGQSVAFSLGGAAAELSRRIFDFTSGVCYASGGSMKKVGTQVYLMTPNDVEVSDEDLKGYET